MNAKIYCKNTCIVLFEANIQKGEYCKFMKFLKAHNFAYDEKRDVWTNGKHDCTIF